MEVAHVPHVLVIAGTDSSGGAGLVRDIQVLTELGARASCVVTAVTAQTSSRVESACVLSPELVRQQLRTALQAGDVGAIKIGMLGNSAIVRAVLDGLSDERHMPIMRSEIGESPDGRQIPIVLDPVLVSSSGTALLDADGMQLLKDHLLPRCTLITPNLPEAAALLGEPLAATGTEQIRQAEALLRFGPRAVLLKGGHGSEEESIDVLATYEGPPLLLRAKRVNVTMRGTGCALSSAIAALLAAGATMQAACEQAKRYVHDKLLALRPSG